MAWIMYVFSHGALSWRGSEFTSHRLSYAVKSRHLLPCSSCEKIPCMLYVLQPVICFVVHVRTVSMFVNQEQRNFPKCFEDTFDTFWICVARAAMAEQRSDGDAHSLLVRACCLIRAACMHIMLHANTNLCVGVG